MLLKIWRGYFSSYTNIDRKLWLILLVNLINRVGSTSVFFLSLYFQRELNFSVAAIGFLLGLYGLGGIIGNLLNGFLSDHLSPFILLLLSLSLSGFTFILLSLLGTYSAIMLVLIFLGTTVSLAQPSMTIILGQLAIPKIRIKVFAIYRVINNIGIAIAGILGGIAAGINFKSIFYIDGLTSLLAFLTIGYLIYQKYFILNTLHNSEATQSKGPSFREVLSDKDFMVILLLTLLTLMMFMQITSIYPIYLHQAYGLDTTNIGLLFSINGILIALLQVPLTKLSYKLRIPTLTSIGTLLIGLGLGLLPFGSQYSFVIASCILWTFGEMLFFPANTSLAFNHIKYPNKGRYISLYETTFSLARLLFPILGTIIYQHFGINTIWYLSLIMSCFIALSYYLLKTGTSGDSI